MGINNAGRNFLHSERIPHFLFHRQQPDSCTKTTGLTGHSITWNDAEMLDSNCIIVSFLASYEAHWSRNRFTSGETKHLSEQVDLLELFLVREKKVGGGGLNQNTSWPMRWHFLFTLCVILSVHVICSTGTEKSNVLPIMSHSGIKVLLGLAVFVGVVEMEGVLPVYWLRMSACPLSGVLYHSVPTP